MNTELDKRREEFQRKVTELTNAQLMINSELHGHQMQLERLRHPLACRSRESDSFPFHLAELLGKLRSFL